MLGNPEFLVACLLTLLPVAAVDGPGGHGSITGCRACTSPQICRVLSEAKVDSMLASRLRLLVVSSASTHARNQIPKKAREMVRCAKTCPMMIGLARGKPGSKPDPPVVVESASEASSLARQANEFHVAVSKSRDVAGMWGPRGKWNGGHHQGRVRVGQISRRSDCSRPGISQAAKSLQVDTGPIGPKAPSGVPMQDAPSGYLADADPTLVVAPIPLSQHTPLTSITTVQTPATNVYLSPRGHGGVTVGARYEGPEYKNT
ncbi:hypothetical protein C8R44DRAFT_861680 [Mycena epipterygia]|nr:hypothetical protein C8R44DRAFT_861680 [Mycena epipterygia]